MSNQTEIERLGGARNKIRKKLVSMGLAQDTDKLDALAEKLDAIPILHGVQEVLDVNNPRCSIPAGYYGGEGEVGIALEEKTVTPTDTRQIITPSEGCVLSQVTVEAAGSGGGGSGDANTITVTVTINASPSQAENIFIAVFNSVPVQLGTPTDVVLQAGSAAAQIWLVNFGSLTVTSCTVTRNGEDDNTGVHSMTYMPLTSSGAIVSYFPAGYAKIFDTLLSDGDNIVFTFS